MAKPIPDDAEILMRIGHHPKVALALGLFVAAYAGLELALWRLYAKVLGHPHEGQTIQLTAFNLLFTKWRPSNGICRTAG